MSNNTNGKLSKSEIIMDVVTIVVQTIQIVIDVRGPEKNARDLQKLKHITRAATRKGTILGDIIIMAGKFCDKKLPFLTK